MARIFSEATKVLAWLGNGDPVLIQRALDYICWYLNRGDIPALAKYHRLLRRMGESDLRLASYHWNKEDASRHSTESIAFKDPPDDKTLEALDHIYNRSYYRRGWIVQEVALPRVVEVLYGEACIDNLFIHEFASLQNGYDPPYFKGTTEMTIAIIKTISLLRNTLHNSYNKWSFVDLLMMTVHHEFSDPRDKIYGILGLQDVCYDFDLERLHFKPDYTISVMECYKSIIQTMVVDRGDMGFLTLVTHVDLPVDHWPSWVPRLDERRTEQLLNTVYYLLPTPGCLEATATRQTLGGHDCMQIRGILVSKVEAVRKLLLHDSEYMQILVKSLQDRFGERSVAWTMTRGRTVSGVNMQLFPEDEAQHMDAYRAFIHLGAAEAELQGESLSMILNVDPFYRAICHRLEDFVLFETEDVQLGIGQESIQPGDQVVWFFGGRMPFILRPAGDKWRLVGVCFMYDLMEGEPVSQMEYDARYMAEDFTIF
ncbi:hypothetical protein E8E13_000577 [Curvularia kusanoi]|uniref:Heterokaryon incompatibility domain-containing protein n=1 Tax=Curvularia kusanoi TaxID=90978 RepID=A0A9P4T5C8_CURKU|nr:hypothetical protein E8E13_000577 [Curvularia kusanoi]